MAVVTDDDRAPLPVNVLLDARHDTLHKEGPSRPVRAVRDTLRVTLADLVRKPAGPGMAQCLAEHVSTVDGRTCYCRRPRYHGDGVHVGDGVEWSE